MPKIGIHLSSAQQILNEYSNVISMVEQGDTGFEIVKDQLEDKVKQVNKITLDAFASLGYTKSTVKENEKELSNVILEMQKGTQNLNGNALNKAFIQKFQEADPFSYSIQKEYNQFIKFLKEISIYNLKEEEDNIATTFVREVLFKGKDNETFIIDKNGQFRSKQSGKLGFGKFTYDFSRLGKKTKKFVLDFMNHNQTFQLYKYLDQSNDTELSQEYLLKTVDIYSFLKMPSEERKLLFRNYPELENKINECFIKAVQDTCTCSTEDKQLIAECAKHIITQGKEKSPFFIGQNIVDFTGIIGELQGLYFFRKIIKSKKINSEISWIGGINNPHADLLLTSALGEFGIQIKNTSYDRAKDELYNIEFKDFAKAAKSTQIQGTVMSYDLTQSAASELRRLGFTNSISEAIQNALAADVFNVPYIWENKRAKQVQLEELNNRGLKASDFQNLRPKIEYYADKAEKIMALFSIALMYLQTTSTTNGGESNTFYLIAGSVITSAATILATIVEEINNDLERMKHFNIKVKTGHHHNRNIVDFLNNDKSISHRDIMQFSLQSSYNFG